jgi:hypothetical protein
MPRIGRKLPRGSSPHVLARERPCEDCHIHEATPSLGSAGGADGCFRSFIQHAAIAAPSLRTSTADIMAL